MERGVTSTVGIPATRTIERVTLVLGAVFGLGVLVTTWAWVPSLHAFETPQEFGAAFARVLRRQRLALLPLGAATAIGVLVGLILHGTLRPWRVRLQALAAVALTVSAFFSDLRGVPVGEAIVAAAAAGSTGELSVLLPRWATFATLNGAIAAAVVLSLVAAQRLPVPAPAATHRGLTAHHRTLLLLLGAATLFEGYDRFIVSLALPYIGRDLGASEGALGIALALIRLGALVSLVLGRLADQHGRRRLLLFTILAYTLATAATGFSRGLIDFVILQLLANIFLVTELALAQVVIAEEFPADQRAQGQGFLGAFAALGAGVAAMLFPLLQQTSVGWRGLYFIGILPLLLIAYLRRELPETRRWQQARVERTAERVPLAELMVPAHRAPFLVLVLLAGIASAAGAAAFTFASYRATTTFQWTATQVSTMLILGGSIGLCGWFAFGRLAERLGRRPVGIIASVFGGLAGLAYYQTSWLMPAFAALVFSEAGVAIALNSLGTELFPTRMRTTAKTGITIAGILGATAGLALVGALSRAGLAGIDTASAVLALLPALASPALLRLPESRGLELERLAE
jgi:putative MFS transporter